MNKIGRIYGDIVDNKFSFATKTFFDGDFVVIKKNERDDTSGMLVCEIVNRSVYNKFLSSPEIVKYMDDQMDFSKDTIYTYVVSALGTVKNGKLSYDKINALPGKTVYEANADLLKQVFDITDTGIEIGYLKKMPECRVTLEVDRIFQPHMFVVGKTGSGKSYFMQHFLQGVREKFWVFSPSEEYNDAVKGYCL